jgi:hypothetical protein
MAWGVKLGRVVQTPFGQISDATLRAGVGKYALQCMLLLVSLMMLKRFYLIGLLTAAITVAMYYQWPLMRFLAWRKSWFKHYFYGHLVVSILVGILIGDNRPGWVVLWGLISLLFAYAFMASFSDDIEDLMQGRITFNKTAK